MRTLLGCFILVAFVGAGSLTASIGMSKTDQVTAQNTVRAALAHDVQANALTIPVYVEGGKMTLVQSNVANIGENPESFAVEFGRIEWDGTFTVHRTKTVENLPAGESQNVSFGFFSFPKNVEYDYFVRVVLDGDMNPDNDVASQAVNSFTTMRNLVLIEKGTGTWCQYCPGAAVCVDSLMKVFPDQVAAIDYHVGDKFEHPSCRSRVEYYELSGYPTAWFDGIGEIVGGSSAYDTDDLWRMYKGKVNTALAKHGTCLEMETTYSREDSHIKAKTKLTGVATSYVRSFRLYYAVIESHIYNPWRGLDSLQHVFRGMYPNMDGIPIIGDENIQEGWSYENEIEFDLPDGVVKKNCEVVAFVQNVENKVVMAAAHAQEVEAPVQMIEVTAEPSLTLEGSPGEEFISEGTIHNMTDEPVPVRLQKIAGAMPEDWSASICIEFCLAPWIDVVYDTVAANDSLSFSLHLYSGASPDSGDIALKISTLADSSENEGPNTFWLSLSGRTSWPARVAKNTSAPLAFALEDAYPNPFNPATSIRYSLAERCHAATLQVYSVRGRLVAEVPLRGLQAGEHSYRLDASYLAGGVYLYRILAESTSGTHNLGFKKFTVLK